MEEESSRRNHGGGIIEEESLRRSHGGGIIEKESLRRNHEGGIHRRFSPLVRGLICPHFTRNRPPCADPLHASTLCKPCVNLARAGLVRTAHVSNLCEHCAFHPCANLACVHCVRQECKLQIRDCDNALNRYQAHLLLTGIHPPRRSAYRRMAPARDPKQWCFEVLFSVRMTIRPGWYGSRDD